MEPIVSAYHRLAARIRTVLHPGQGCVERVSTEQTTMAAGQMKTTPPRLPVDWGTPSSGLLVEPQGAREPSMIGGKIKQIYCSCGGNPTAVEPTDEEEAQYGCRLVRGCCVQAYQCATCGTRWTVDLDAPDPGWS